MTPYPLTARHWLSLFFVAALSWGGGWQASQAAEPIDPPGRVGRLAWVSGPVSLLADGRPEAAALNWPLTSGQTLITGASGRAEIRIGSASLRLDGNTELELVRVDDGAVQIALVQGTLMLSVRNRDWLNEIDLSTARARVELLAPGRYRIEADPGRTGVGTPDGLARVLSGRLSFTVHAGELGELSGEPYPSFRRLPYRSDAIDEWAAARDRRELQQTSQRYVSPETPGAEALDDYGRWSPVEPFGNVWFPTAVGPDWAPYQYGRWAWIAPWGWTWVDAAPWGFAPFHYGRWALIGGRWGWVPGGWVARPVYAPALVIWNTAPGPGGRIGWSPLGPGDAFQPWYRNPRLHANPFDRGQIRPLPPAPAMPLPQNRPGAIGGRPGQDFGRPPPRPGLAPIPAPETHPIPTRPLPPPGDGYKRIPRPIPVPGETTPRAEPRPGAPAVSRPAPVRIAPSEPSRPTPPAAGPPRGAAPARIEPPQAASPQPSATKLAPTRRNATVRESRACVARSNRSCRRAAPPAGNRGDGAGAGRRHCLSRPAPGSRPCPV